MQLHPIKPTLKPTGSQRLKLKCDILLSIFAFKLNLRRYNEEKPGGDVLPVHSAAATAAAAAADAAAATARLSLAGGVLRARTRPTLNRRAESVRLYSYELST